MRAVRQPGIRNRPYSAEDVETAVRLSIEGESDPAIARRLGRTVDSVRRKLDRIGIPGLRCNGHCHGLRLCVPNEAYAALINEAEQRALPVERLVAHALVTLATEPNMLVNVLDWRK